MASVLRAAPALAKMLRPPRPGACQLVKRMAVAQIPTWVPFREAHDDIHSVESQQKLASLLEANARLTGTVSTGGANQDDIRRFNNLQPVVKVLQQIKSLQEVADCFPVAH